jgi:alkylated DNA repair dioxygenase AlkB
VVVAWQSSLFADEAPSPDADFGSCRRVELAHGAWLDHQPGWLAGSERLLTDLVAEAPWAQRTRHMYDKVVDEPRLTAWWDEASGDDGLPPAVVQARRLLGSRYGVRFTSVGCNLYRDGSDSVAWHGDTIRKVLDRAVVAIVSLGAPRRFLLRPRGGGASMRFDLGAGDLLVMGGTCQRTWEHTVPKVAAAGPRLSVTFRHREPLPG